MKKKILVVDDSLTVKKYFEFVFKKIGEFELFFSDSSDALKVVKERCPDLIFLDIYMPEIDGLTLLKEIKQIGTCEQKPCIIMTSLRHSRKLAEALELGASDFIIKTGCTKEVIKEKLQKALV